MRSLVQLADRGGIEALLDQQFEYADQVLAAGLIPILEPAVDIASPAKEQAEALLEAGLRRRLDDLAETSHVMLKLSLPSIAGYYSRLVQHPRVVRVLALSGGYSRMQANQLLAANPGMVASFSRALLEDLTVQQSDAEFARTLDGSIAGIYAASIG